MTVLMSEDFQYVEIVTGDIKNRGKMGRFDEMSLPDPPVECYHSLNRFDQRAADYVNNHKTVLGMPDLECWPSYLLLDIDNPDLNVAQTAARQLVKRITGHYGLDQSMIQVWFSGQKGFHIGIDSNTIGLVPFADNPRVCKRLVKILAGGIPYDPVIYDRTRLIRAENSIHGKTGLYKIPLTIDELHSLSIAQIKELAKSPRQIAHDSDSAITVNTKLKAEYDRVVKEVAAGRRRPVPLAATHNPNPVGTKIPDNHHPPCIIGMLAGVGEGMRDEVAIRLVAHFRNKGLSKEEILLQMGPWNLRNRPPLSDRTITDKVESAFKSEYNWNCRFDDILRSFGENECESCTYQKSPTPIITEPPKLIHPALDFVDGVAYTAQPVWIDEPDAKSGQLKRVQRTAVITSERRLIILPAKAKPSSGILTIEGLAFGHVPIGLEQRWSPESINGFLSGENNEIDVELLLSDLIAEFQRRIIFSDPHEIYLVICWIVGTYFFRLFTAYPYLYINGLKGTGKSTLGRLIAALSFNGKLWTDPTAAALFRTIEANRPTLILDEMENIQNRQASEYPIVAILKAGYQKGGEVPRIAGRENDRVDNFGVYGPKAICNVLGLEDILADRAIPVTMARQDDKSLGKICPDQPDFEDRRWFRFRDELYQLLMKHHQEIAKLAKSPPFNIPFVGRNRELFTPPLVMAHFLDSLTGMAYNLQNNTLALCREKSEQRQLTDINAPDIILKNALLDLLGDEEVVQVTSYEIIEACHAQSSMRLKWLNDTWVGKQLKVMGIVRSSDCTRKRTLIAEFDQVAGRVIERQKKLRAYLIRKSRIK